MSTRTSRIPRAALALGGAVALALAAPLAASAHVTLAENQAAAGSYPLLTFTVPSESDTATTTTVTVTLPADTPFPSVRTVAVPGWTAELVRTTLPEPVTVGDGEITEAVTSVVWTADAGGIGSTELGLFALSVGPVPDTGSIVLPVAQGYSDGTVVSWSETGDDAEHPAPVLYVNDEPAGDHHAAAGDTHADDDAAVTVEPGDTGSDGAASSGDDVLARALGVAGLTVAAVALVLVIVRRRNAADRDEPTDRTDA